MGSGRSPRSSKPLAASKAAAGSIPASSVHEGPMSDLSKIPQVEQLLSLQELEEWSLRLSRFLVKGIIQKTLEEVRQEGAVPPREEIVRTLLRRCEEESLRSLQEVLNGTGILLHTNLGRCPIPRSVWRRAEELNCSYSNLELSLTTGERGKRGGLLSELMAAYLKAEDALLVNNNAAALYLILGALAKGREVLVSRGQQVQIGGGFRIPEILESSGAILKEVGTTNITTLEDYIRGVNENTALVLLVHTSNYAIRGFTQQPGVRALRKVLPKDIPLVLDQGSGIVEEKLPQELGASAALKQGLDLICFSTDKIFGGPQGGGIAGRKDLIRTLAAYPLMRALRPGKTICSLLEKILIEKLNGGFESVVTRGLATEVETLYGRAEAICQSLGDERVYPVESNWSVGGGTTPDQFFPSWSLRLDLPGVAGDHAACLRRGNPSLLGVIRRSRVEVNLASLPPEEDRRVTTLLDRLLQGAG